MYETKTTGKKPKSGGNHPHSATQMEIIAAIQGKVEAREVKGNKRQNELIREGVNGMPIGRPLGVTTGLPIFMAICYALQQNERAPREDKLTDQGLAEWFRHEFPGRPTKYWDRVQDLRAKYHAGRFTRGTCPKVRSHRYDSGGEVIDTIYRRRG